MTHYQRLVYSASEYSLHKEGANRSEVRIDEVCRATVTALAALVVLFANCVFAVFALLWIIYRSGPRIDASPLIIIPLVLVALALFSIFERVFQKSIESMGGLTAVSKGLKKTSKGLPSHRLYYCYLFALIAFLTLLVILLAVANNS